jgi:hypothetical protein
MPKIRVSRLQKKKSIIFLDEKKIKNLQIKKDKITNEMITKFSKFQFALLHFTFQVQIGRRIHYNFYVNLSNCQDFFEIKKIHNILPKTFSLSLSVSFTGVSMYCPSCQFHPIRGLCRIVGISNFSRRLSFLRTSVNEGEEEKGMKKMK